MPKRYDKQDAPFASLVNSLFDRFLLSAARRREAVAAGRIRPLTGVSPL